MKAAVFHGPRDVRFEEVAKPVLGGRGGDAENKGLRHLRI